MQNLAVMPSTESAKKLETIIWDLDITENNHISNRGYELGIQYP